MARVQHWRGNLARAVELRSRAVGLSEGSAMEADLTRTLDGFEADAKAKAEESPKPDAPK